MGINEVPGDFHFDYNVYYTDINGNKKITRTTIYHSNTVFTISNPIPN